jgi:RNA polymerase sigma factor (sigma-70 family)
MGQGAEAHPRRAGAFEELVQRYGRLIKSVVARVARRHRGLTDDIEQRVATALWRRIDADATIEHPATYIYRCAVREAVRAVQREEARATELLDDELPGAAPAPDQALAGRELAERVARCAAGLGDERRRAVTAHLAGFTVEEIMAMHGWPYQKARNLIARGMSDLRARLRAEGVDVD